MLARTRRPGSWFLHTSAPRHLSWRKAAFLAGVASTLLYFCMDVLASSLVDGYSYRDQTISELSAVDAPAWSYWITFGAFYSLLTFAFGLRVWSAAGGKRSLRIVGACAAGVGLSGLVWPFAPMHSREVLEAGGATFSDTLHLILAGVNTFFFIVSIVVGANALGKRFRLYSIATILAVLLFGALNAVSAPKVADNESTPWMGIFERISVEGSMVWYAVLAIMLWRKEDERSSLVVRADASPALPGDH